MAMSTQIFFYFVNSFMSTEKFYHFFPYRFCLYGLQIHMCITNTTTATQIEPDIILSNMHVLFLLIFSLTLWEKCQLLFLFIKSENQSLERLNNFTNAVRIVIKVAALKPNCSDSMKFNHYVKAIYVFLGAL